jgi:hypothetical protein
MQMARPFSIPAIPALAVGESYVVPSGNRGGVARKVYGYGDRCKPNRKCFLVVSEREGIRVTRLPDPEQAAE